MCSVERLDEVLTGRVVVVSDAVDQVALPDGELCGAGLDVYHGLNLIWEADALAEASYYCSDVTCRTGAGALPGASPSAAPQRRVRRPHRPM